MDTQQLATLTMLLDLNGYEVVEMTEDPVAKTRRLVIVPTELAASCVHCGEATCDRHACHDSRPAADLPLGGWKTELIVRGCQFHCGKCGKFFTPPRPMMGKGMHATIRLLDRLAELVNHGDISSAAAFFGVPEKTAANWYYAYLKQLKEPTRELKPIRSIGIDELSLKKDTVSSSAW